MIYLFSEVVRLARMATLADVRKLEGRKPDKRDRDALALGSYVVVVTAAKRERLCHQAYLKADGGSLEIQKEIDGLAVLV